MHKPDSQNGGNQVSWHARLASVGVRALLKPVLGPPLPLPWQRRIVALMMCTFPRPSGVRRQVLTLDGIEAEKLIPAQYVDGENGQAMLYWHGGGYAMGSPAAYRGLTMRLAASTGLPLIVPRYRLAPEHPYPAQRDDALRCLLALEREGLPARRLIFAGDSAGGNLALTLALQCKASGWDAPLGLVLISPWVEIFTPHDRKNRQDAMLSARWIHQLRDAYVPEQLRDPALFSTTTGELSGLPKTLLQYASAEMLAPEVRRLGHRMRSAGVDVTVDEAPGLWHDYQLHAGLVPEASAAIARIAAFVREP